MKQTVYSAALSPANMSSEVMAELDSEIKIEKYVSKDYINPPTLIAGNALTIETLVTG
jgi:hypothetical protein